MKLEPGQVWRRPDGTRWKVDAVRPPTDADHTRANVAEMRNTQFPALVIAFPSYVVSEGWTLEAARTEKGSAQALVTAPGAGSVRSLELLQPTVQLSDDDPPDVVAWSLNPEHKP